MSKYAIIETGSKQYWVEQNSVLEIELLELAENQKEVVLEDVLLVNDGQKLLIGNPTVKGAKVVCSLVGEFRAPKVIAFKRRPKKASRRKRGHRQDLLRLLVKEIKVAN